MYHFISETILHVSYKILLDRHIVYGTNNPFQATRYRQWGNRET